MGYDGSLIFDTKVDTSGFNKGTNSLKSAGASMTGTFKKMGVAIAAAFSIKQLISFGKESVGLASDLTEVQNVVDTAFGSMSYKMEEFADKAIETYGISKLTAKQTGSTFMAMGAGMGIAQGAASDMAVAMTGLSADMSSFYNVEQDVAATALKSVYTGETETLKQFGIVMTETNLEAFALSQGITKSYQSMSQAEKVQLRYNFVMNQTALAQGDFAKTSQSWANQTRILSQKWKEFMSTVGTLIMNVALPAVQLLNQAMNGLIAVANGISEAFGFGEIAQSSSQTAKNTANISGDMADTAQSAEDTEKAMSATASIDELNVISNDNAASSDSSGTAGIGTATSKELAKDNDFVAKMNPTIAEIVETLKPFVDLLKRFGEAIKKLFEKIDWEKIGAALKEVWEALEPVLLKIGDLFVWIFETILSPLIETAANKVLPFFLKMYSAIFKLVSVILDIIIPILKDWWQNILLPIFNFIIEQVGRIYEFISGVLTGITDFLQGVFTGNWEQAWNGLCEIFSAFTNFIWSTICGAWDLVCNLLSNIGKWVYINVVKPVADFFVGLWNGICNGCSAAWNWICDVFNGVASWFKKYIIDPVVGFFKAMWDGIVYGAKVAWWGIKVGVLSMVNFVTGIINKMIKGILAPFNFLIDGLNLIPGVNISHISLAIPTISLPPMPKLATGTVVPANYGEFAAILGDNKREPEVVSPLSTIKQAVAEVIAQMGGVGNEQVIELLREIIAIIRDKNFSVELDGDKISRKVDEWQRNRGANVSNRFANAY